MLVAYGNILYQAFKTFGVLFHKYKLHKVILPHAMILAAC